MQKRSVVAPCIRHLGHSFSATHSLSSTVIQEQEVEELPPILRMLPDEMMAEVLGHLSPYALGAIAGVCKGWRAVVLSPRLWKAACAQAFKQQFDQSAMAHEVMTRYDSSWRGMFLTAPHLRFDGVFVSRNTYCRVGVIEMRERKPVHLVSYYRYWRFFDDGTLNYRTSPLTVGKVSREGPPLTLTP